MSRPAGRPGSAGRHAAADRTGDQGPLDGRATPAKRHERVRADGHPVDLTQHPITADAWAAHARCAPVRARLPRAERWNPDLDHLQRSTARRDAHHRKEVATWTTTTTVPGTTRSHPSLALRGSRWSGSPSAGSGTPAHDPVPSGPLLPNSSQSPDSPCRVEHNPAIAHIRPHGGRHTVCRHAACGVSLQPSVTLSAVAALDTDVGRPSSSAADVGSSQPLRVVSSSEGCDPTPGGGRGWWCWPPPGARAGRGFRGLAPLGEGG
jgi:hypothetical protein